MDKQQKWLNEVMAQNIDASLGKDYTRLAFNFFFLKNNLFENKVEFLELKKYIYRFYIDNKEFAEINPSPLIKNIRHYKPEDLTEYVYEQVMIWKKDKDSLLMCDREYINIEGNIMLDEEYYKKYCFIIKMIFKKFMNKEFFYDENTLEKFDSAMPKEEYLEYMKKSKLRNRMFEYINYCPLCEETNENKLNAIHINHKSSMNENVDLDNVLLLCDEHCKMYINGDFVFKENGYINIIKENDKLDNRMHLGVDILNCNRKKYIKETY